ncbi:hypothetical protein JCM11641_003932 [Rhodosporidiobolus odoratus]
MRGGGRRALHKSVAEASQDYFLASGAKGQIELAVDAMGLAYASAMKSAESTAATLLQLGEMAGKVYLCDEGGGGTADGRGKAWKAGKVNRQSGEPQAGMDGSIAFGVPSQGPYKSVAVAVDYLTHGVDQPEPITGCTFEGVHTLSEGDHTLASLVQHLLRSVPPLDFTPTGALPSRTAFTLSSFPSEEQHLISACVANHNAPASLSMFPDSPAHLLQALPTHSVKIPVRPFVETATEAADPNRLGLEPLPRLSPTDWAELQAAPPLTTDEQFRLARCLALSSSGAASEHQGGSADGLVPAGLAAVMPDTDAAEMLPAFLWVITRIVPIRGGTRIRAYRVGTALALELSKFVPRCLAFADGCVKRKELEWAGQRDLRKMFDEQAKDKDGGSAGEDAAFQRERPDGEGGQQPIRPVGAVTLEEQRLAFSSRRALEESLQRGISNGSIRVSLKMGSAMIDDYSPVVDAPKNAVEFSPTTSQYTTFLDPSPSAQMLLQNLVLATELPLPPPSIDKTLFSLARATSLFPSDQLTSTTDFDLGTSVPLSKTKVPSFIKGWSEAIRKQRGTLGMTKKMVAGGGVKLRAPVARSEIVTARLKAWEDDDDADRADAAEDEMEEAGFGVEDEEEEDEDNITSGSGKKTGAGTGMARKIAISRLKRTERHNKIEEELHEVISMLSKTEAFRAAARPATYQEDDKGAPLILLPDIKLAPPPSTAFQLTFPFSLSSSTSDTTTIIRDEYRIAAYTITAVKTVLVNTDQMTALFPRSGLSRSMISSAFPRNDEVAPPGTVLNRDHAAGVGARLVLDLAEIYGVPLRSAEEERLESYRQQPGWDESIFSRSADHLLQLLRCTDFAEAAHRNALLRLFSLEAAAEPDETRVSAVWPALPQGLEARRRASAMRNRMKRLLPFFGGDAESGSRVVERFEEEDDTYLEEEDELRAYVAETLEGAGPSLHQVPRRVLTNLCKKVGVVKQSKVVMGDKWAAVRQKICERLEIEGDFFDDFIGGSLVWVVPPKDDPLDRAKPGMFRFVPTSEPGDDGWLDGSEEEALADTGSAAFSTGDAPAEPSVDVVQGSSPSADPQISNDDSDMEETPSGSPPLTPSVHDPSSPPASESSFATRPQRDRRNLLSSLNLRELAGVSSGEESSDSEAEEGDSEEEEEEDDCAGESAEEDFGAGAEEEGSDDEGEEVEPKAKRVRRR